MVEGGRRVLPDILSRAASAFALDRFAFERGIGTPSHSSFGLGAFWSRSRPAPSSPRSRQVLWRFLPQVQRP
jgi:hypothetical protein